MSPGGSEVFKLLFLLFVVWLETSGVDVNDSEALIVSLPNGKIQGRERLTANGKTYYAFQEIPYASPPIGDLRFKEPTGPANWDDVKDTSKNTKICWQRGVVDEAPNVEKSEDCLYINVATPMKPGGNSSDLLPVVVWIHGGGFRYGDGTYQTTGPQFFIDHDVVVVSLNYRLGPFGFLTTLDGVIPANLGLKDQNYALKWVQKNINLFGGDPNAVTLMGQSAGGAAVAYHLLSEQSEGLFRAAILMSGTAQCSFSYQSSPKNYAFELGSILGLSDESENSTKLLTHLKSLEASVIIKANVTVPSSLQNTLGTNVWAAVIEDTSLDGAFLTGAMHDDIKSGKINKVPILIGFASEEEITFISRGRLVVEAIGKALDKNIANLVELDIKMESGKRSLAGRKLKQIYTTTSFQNNFPALLKFLSDARFTTPIINHADLQSSYTDVYLYQLSHKGRLGGINETVAGADTVGHAEDLKYIWEYEGTGVNSDLNQFPVSDILTHRRIMKLWTNFIKYLNPTPDNDALLQNIIWPKVKSDSLSYLDINSTLSVKTDPKKYKTWKEILDLYALTPITIY